MDYDSGDLSGDLRTETKGLRDIAEDHKDDTEAVRDLAISHVASS